MPFCLTIFKVQDAQNKDVSISLTEAKYFNVVGILTSQDGPKAIFVIGKREGPTSVLPHTFTMHAYSNFILFLPNSLIGIESKNACIIINVWGCIKRESYVVPIIVSCLS